MPAKRCDHQPRSRARFTSACVPAVCRVPPPRATIEGMLRSFLLPAGVLVAGFVVGVALMAGNHPMLGMVLGLSAVPIALVVWVVSGDRL